MQSNRLGCKGFLLRDTLAYLLTESLTKKKFYIIVARLLSQNDICSHTFKVDLQCNRLGCKGLQGPNTLAYLLKVSLTKKKFYIIVARLLSQNDICSYTL